mmetsp:Transcript_30761/g.46542  ORF Transcript_30761/g.46542 Transcript_30761/m.46542 type:complete len:83 (+) Transcript_30761:1817-2065(+)
MVVSGYELNEHATFLISLFTTVRFCPSFFLTVLFRPIRRATLEPFFLAAVDHCRNDTKTRKGYIAYLCAILLYSNPADQECA